MASHITYFNGTLVCKTALGLGGEVNLGDWSLLYRSQIRKWGVICRVGRSGIYMRKGCLDAKPTTGQ